MSRLRYLIMLLLALRALGVAGQDASRNYVKTVTMLDSAGRNAVTEIQYYDVLGRPDLFSTTGLGGSGVAVYTGKTYDRKGRVREERLPSTSAGGSGDRYTVTHYDGLDRPVFTESPGQDWKDNDKGVSVAYSTNTSKEVKHYVAHVGSNTLTTSGRYAARTLHAVTTTDEDGHSVKVYTDRLGRKVLERRNYSSPVLGNACLNNNDTYFVYDEKGLLRFVLSPEYQNDADLSLYAYEYRYDGRGRLVWSRIPGCGHTQYWYDEGDRVQFVQDADLRAASRCRFMLFDALGRLAVQGTCGSISESPSVGTAAYVPGSDGFCGTCYSVAQQGLLEDAVLEKACYYDDYGFVTSVAATADLDDRSRLVTVPTASAVGLPTGTVYVASDGNLMEEAVYYDARQRPVSVRRLYADGTLFTEKTSYTFTGKAKYVIHTLEKDGEVRNVRTTNTYNAHNDQPVRTLIASGQTSMTLSERTYDNLGRLSGLKRGTGAGTVSYTYNERDWVSQITAGGFSETLHYADGPGTACYNGDVSSMAWKVSGEPMKRGYKFSYDGLDRLADALYGEGDGLVQNAGRYTERVTDYSANGAIRRMQRYGRMTDGGYGLTDDLTVTLHGNQLKAVSDAAGTQVYNGSFDFKDGASAQTEYSYSDGGALTMDANKGISRITYDESGHPMQVLFASGNLTEYSYDADGVKWSVAHHTAAPHLPVSSIGSPASGSYYMLSSHKTEYFGSFIREDGVVTKYLFDGGYCTFTQAGVPVAHYYTRDHLGNVREVVDGDGTVEQVTHYYPFGGIFGDACTGDGIQKYKYNGKELDRTHGLDTYDYGARMYDAALPVWDRPDPLAHKYYHVSPYAYCGNNPVKYIDPDGKIVKIWYMDSQNNNQYYIFTGFHGQKSISIPNNCFVKAVIQSYVYNCKNGGGDIFRAAVHSKKTIYIDDARLYDGENCFENNGHQPTVYWNPNTGLKTSDGGLQSPATSLEHEMDHAYDYVNNAQQHNKRSGEVDVQYDTREERRVITGSEAKTAKANGESTRLDHRGTLYQTISPTTTKELK